MSKLEVNEKVIRTLAGLLDETDLSEIEYEADGHRIRLVRGGTVVHAAAPAPVAAPATAAPAASDTGGVPVNAITSPMVGTAYLSGEPGAPTFVKVGDSVTEGQTLLILEAMKVMNPLPSPKSGVVKQILVSDGQPIEFGEPLMVIE
ncbi:acetyl-CoA carboxylase [Kiloniella spongiae]|uniref:Biotin carboxyl carrier protein of acetyl-CoA carboxylase n=1 Tax=Kiloniella spongiae TaxID=1489064 RepID=A0A0H2MSD2_9PROT|nr:acetyl-CoA carboxylase biotin carboxyl carrier protein subunit [Kiloniella spongiae]KLN59545.1 acetyl-CoA carboxylase [Kiloniella spongiae]